MALAVAVYHLDVWTEALSGRVHTCAVICGIYSVQGFFIISGFCFFMLYGRARFDWPELKRFHTRRFLRIAPLLYAAIALSYLTGTLSDPRAGFVRLAENLTLSFALFHPNHALVLGGWSIGVEYLFYAVFPLLALLTRRRVVLYAALLLALAMAVRVTFLDIAAAPQPDQFNVYVRVSNHAFLFLMGGVIADLRERTSFRWSLGSALALSLGLGWLALYGQPEIRDHVAVMVGWMRVKYLLACAAIVWVCALCRPTRWGVPWAFRWLGDVSYSVYLMHPIAWFIVSRGSAAAQVDLSPVGRLACGLALTLTLAACSERVIERPAIALGRRLSR
jgi:peptidoglycan/LPS O-acetylase OafA/YrhL